MNWKKVLLFTIVWLPALLRGQDFLLVTEDQELYAVNVDNCNRTFITNISSPGNVSIGDITFTPDGTLWGIGTNGRLFTINQGNGSTVLEHSFPSFGQLYTAMVADATGLLYIADETGDLYTYNPVTDEDNYIGDVGPGAAGDLTFVDGQLVMATVNNSMLAINLEAPSNSSVVLNFFVNSSIFGIVTFVEDCENTVTYATSGDGEVYDIDFETGNLTELCDLGGSSFGAASELEFLAAEPINVESVEVDSSSCTAATGSIEVTASSLGMIQYSLDGVNFQSDNTFSNLPEGTYTVYMQDDNSCEEEIEVEIFANDAPVITEVFTEEALCGETTGSLTVAIEGGTVPYEYQMDEGPFVSSNTFSGLAEGIYDITIRDAQGCIDEVEVTIAGSPPLMISMVEIEACGGENNRIRIFPVGGSFDYQYRLNGSPLQSSSQFEGLMPGPFTVEVVDSDGCTISYSDEIPDIEPLELSLVELQACGANNNFFSVAANGGNEGYQYILNDDAPQASPLFESLPPGNYRILVEDMAGCASEVLEVNIPAVEGIQLADIETTPNQCGKRTGSISFTASGGTPPLDYSLNGQSQANSPIEDLNEGVFLLEVSDAVGCTLSDTVLVEALCPIYIPSAFSPNEDGRNDRFQVYSGIPIEIIDYQVFNRWGSLAYEAKGFNTISTDRFWDGTSEGEVLNPGLYVYRIRLINAQGEVEEAKGEVLLVR